MLRELWNDHEADVNMILTAVVMAIVFVISISIVWSVLSGISYTTIDGNIGNAACTPSVNASENLVTNLNTFYTLGPIAIVVVAAVGIIGYVMIIRGR